MDITIFPVLMEVMENGRPYQISEALDAVGYMVFYHPVLAERRTCSQLISLALKYKDNDLIVWKLLMCLSAFPCEESVRILSAYRHEKSILGLEAGRSLDKVSSKG